MLRAGFDILSSLTLRTLLTVLLVWVGLNVVAMFGLKAFERARLEKEYGLRRGILSEFSEQHIPWATSLDETVQLRYRVYVPPDLQPEERLPVFVFLHGSGERGMDNAQQLRSLPSVLTDTRHRSLFRCIVLVPQCPQGMNWQQLRSSRGLGDPVMQMIEDAVTNYHADDRRIYLAGFSMGSFGAWQLTAQNPQRFAAVVPISGGGSPDLAPALTETQLWTVHGANDKTCSVEATRTIVQCIRDRGGPCRYTEFPSVGHGAWKPAFLDSDEILNWMFRQVQLTEKELHP